MWGFTEIQYFVNGKVNWAEISFEAYFHGWLVHGRRNYCNPFTPMSHNWVRRRSYANHKIIRILDSPFSDIGVIHFMLKKIVLIRNLNYSLLKIIRLFLKKKEEEKNINKKNCHFYFRICEILTFWDCNLCSIYTHHPDSNPEYWTLQGIEVAK